MKGTTLVRSLTASVIAFGIAASPVQAAEKTLTVWSHFANHSGVRDFFRNFEEVFEKENPDVDLQMTFYNKKELFASQMTALRAGEGPDVMYLEPDRVQFVESGFVRPIDDVVLNCR